MSGKILHFAYGSNMDLNRLDKRIGNVSSTQRACLSGFRFEFNKLSYRLNTVYANIMLDLDSTVWGVLMNITQQQLDKLDISEGVENGHYRQEKVIVVTDDDVEHEAITYFAEERWVKDGMKPTETYRNYVITGSNEFDLPQEYIERIKKIANIEKGGDKSEYMTEVKTCPATEADLIVQNDIHGFDPNPHSDPPIMHDVLVDGQPAKAGVGSFGAYSTRIVLVFDPPHPEWGDEFATKYFIFDDKELGVVNWGHDGKSFHIEKIVE
ncbi:MAG: gamma-glutamylcyclotransferase [Euryarchaeota archaeon]|jgi:gamma-glutamylcyclotransferase|nr:gamma-glutamylcyclotransferase [Euryarchaeota archaeon]MBT4407239.1 gamma-glutamylcyclotransferase [Euryarchaeota archaeon]